MSKETTNLQRKQFNDWLDSYKLKKNSVILDKTEYNDIVKFLKVNHCEEKNVYNVKKKIKRNKFQLCNFAGLNLFDVLCCPMKVLLLFCYLIVFWYYKNS